MKNLKRMILCIIFYINLSTQNKDMIFLKFSDEIDPNDPGNHLVTFQVFAPQVSQDNKYQDENDFIDNKPNFSAFRIAALCQNTRQFEISPEDKLILNFHLIGNSKIKLHSKTEYDRNSFEFAQFNLINENFNYKCYFLMQKKEGALYIDFLLKQDVDERIMPKNNLNYITVEQNLSEKNLEFCIFDIKETTSYNKKTFIDLTNRDKCFYLQLRNSKNDVYLDLLMMKPDFSKNYRFRGFINKETDMDKFYFFFNKIGIYEFRFSVNELNHVSIVYFPNNVKDKKDSNKTMLQLYSYFFNDLDEKSWMDIEEISASCKKNDKCHYFRCPLEFESSDEKKELLDYLDFTEEVDFEIKMRAGNFSLIEEGEEINYSVNMKNRNTIEFTNFVNTSLFNNEFVYCQIKSNYDKYATEPKKLKFTFNVIFKEFDPKLGTFPKGRIDLMYVGDKLEVFFVDNIEDKKIKKCIPRNAITNSLQQNEKIMFKVDNYNSIYFSKAEFIEEGNFLNQIFKTFIDNQNKIKAHARKNDLNLYILTKRKVGKIFEDCSNSDHSYFSLRKHHEKLIRQILAKTNFYFKQKNPITLFDIETQENILKNSEATYKTESLLNILSKLKRIIQSDNSLQIDKQRYDLFRNLLNNQTDKYTEEEKNKFLQENSREKQILEDYLKILEFRSSPDLAAIIESIDRLESDIENHPEKAKIKKIIAEIKKNDTQNYFYQNTKEALTQISKEDFSNCYVYLTKSKNNLSIKVDIIDSYQLESSRFHSKLVLLNNQISLVVNEYKMLSCEVNPRKNSSVAQLFSDGDCSFRSIVQNMDSYFIRDFWRPQDKGHVFYIRDLKIDKLPVDNLECKINFESAEEMTFSITEKQHQVFFSYDTDENNIVTQFNFSKGAENLIMVKNHEDSITDDWFIQNYDTTYIELKFGTTIDLKLNLIKIAPKKFQLESKNSDEMMKENENIFVFFDMDNLIALSELVKSHDSLYIKIYNIEEDPIYNSYSITLRKSFDFDKNNNTISTYLCHFKDKTYDWEFIGESNFTKTRIQLLFLYDPAHYTDALTNPPHSIHHKELRLNLNTEIKPKFLLKRQVINNIEIINLRKETSSEEKILFACFYYTASTLKMVIIDLSNNDEIEVMYENYEDKLLFAQKQNLQMESSLLFALEVFATVNNEKKKMIGKFSNNNLHLLNLQCNYIKLEGSYSEVKVQSEKLKVNKKDKLISLELILKKTQII